jgi:hypothetical protein
MVIWATAVGAIITDGEEAAGTITAGTITGITRTSAFVIFARAKIDVSSAGLVAPHGAASSIWIRLVGLVLPGGSAAQPRPSSTAIRIRSEWFFAPSFCFSKDVRLATVL